MPFKYILIVYVYNVGIQTLFKHDYMKWISHVCGRSILSRFKYLLYAKTRNVELSNKNVYGKFFVNNNQNYYQPVLILII